MSLNWALWRLVTGSVGSRPLGVFRAAIGVAAVVKGLDIAAQLSHEERIEWAGVELPMELWPLLGAFWFVAAVGLLVGYQSRVAALAIAGLTAFVIQFTGFYSHHFYLLGILALLLSASECGAYASLESLGTGIREKVWRLPVTLLQIQISLVYLFAAIAKTNEDFIPGNVLFFSTKVAFVPPDPEFVTYVPLFMALAVAAILLELFIAVGLWLDSVRPAACGAGLALHAGMIVMLSDDPVSFGRLTIFALLTLSCYLLFLKVPPRARVVVWDESCSFCSAWIRWFRGLDWLGAFSFRGSSEVEGYGHLGVKPERVAEALHLVELDGQVYSGFEAVRRILQMLPVSFLWAPYLGLPAVRAVGDRAYSHLAARRACQIVYAH